MRTRESRQLLVMFCPKTSTRIFSPTDVNGTPFSNEMSAQVPVRRRATVSPSASVPVYRDIIDDAIIDGDSFCWVSTSNTKELVYSSLNVGEYSTVFGNELIVVSEAEGGVNSNRRVTVLPGSLSLGSTRNGEELPLVAYLVIRDE